MVKISIFQHHSAIDYLKFYLKSQPKSGHGLLRKWSLHLGIHTTLMSQIMAKTRMFTEEQAYELLEILSLPRLESDYFMKLVKYERASTKKLKKYYSDQLEVLKKQSEKISERVSSDTSLSDKEHARYYSTWIYSAVRIACSLKDEDVQGQSLENLREKLHLPQAEIRKVIDFLVEADLIAKEGNKFKISSRFTHLSKESVYLPQHHANWRRKAMDRAVLLSDSELMYTSPFTISKKDFADFREKCLLHIQDFQKTLKQSEPDEMACFNMDLFWVHPAS